MCQLKSDTHRKIDQMK